MGPAEPCLASIFAALANDDRLAIIREMGECSDPMTVTAIAHAVGISRFSASRHLRILCDVRLVAARPRGQALQHRLCRTGFEDVEDWLFSDTLPDRLLEFGSPSDS
ncbi:winged helix-turn-helix transcriptional regulator [Microbacterium lushaniae]|nr:winged helix-turn-helix transcriptional regulator [Microbacterium lushaniae]KAA9148885.1 winged helix-turn-helix transcriptional regulator [Microbacterium lushaniae]